MNFYKLLSAVRRHNLNKNMHQSFCKNISASNTIPKLVHHTYFTKQLPNQLQENYDKLKRENPNWEFKLYDDTDIVTYISLHFPNLMQFYERINPEYGAARADFFRYLVIYNEGGIYLDIKCGLSKPLDEIVKTDDQYVLAQHTKEQSLKSGVKLGIYPDIHDPLGEFLQWFIISIKGHPYLKDVINNVCQNIVSYNPFLNQRGKIGTLRLTGPIAYTIPILRILNQHAHTYYEDIGEVGINYGAVQNHENFFKKHYSQLTTPLVTETLMSKSIKALHAPFIALLAIKEYVISDIKKQG